MKHLFKLCSFLLVCLLCACNPLENSEKTLSTHTNILATSQHEDPEQSTQTDPGTTTETDDSTTEDEFHSPDISTTELFVDYMNTLLDALNTIHASITNNISLLSQTTDEELVQSLYVIKENLFSDLETTADHLTTLPLPSEDVTLLRGYMVEAYTYTIEQLLLEYDIVLEASEETDQLEASSIIDYSRITAIQNAKAEIARLSNDAYYSK